MQLALNFSGSVLPDPPPLSRPLLAFLLAAGSPRTAAQCCAGLGMTATDANKRRIRAMAAAAKPAIISGPGRPYVHHLHASTDEILAAARLHDAQVKAEIAARDALLSLYHARASRPARAGSANRSPDC